MRNADPKAKEMPESLELKKCWLDFVFSLYTRVMFPSLLVIYLCVFIKYTLI